MDPIRTPELTAYRLIKPSETKIFANNDDLGKVSNFGTITRGGLVFSVLANLKSNLHYRSVLRWPAWCCLVLSKSASD